MEAPGWQELGSIYALKVFSLSSFTFLGRPFDAPCQPWLSSLRGAEELIGGHDSVCFPALTAVINEGCLGVIYVPFFIRPTTRGNRIISHPVVSDMWAWLIMPDGAQGTSQREMVSGLIRPL